MRLFLSHSTKDKAFVLELAAQLRANGLAPWLCEKDIEYGDDFVAKIEEGLKCDLVLLVLSPEAVRSPWTGKEWASALAREVQESRIRLGVVLLRDCEVPELMRTKQWFDARQDPGGAIRNVVAWAIRMRDQRHLTEGRAPRFFLAYEPKDFVGRERYLERLDGALVQQPGVFLLHGGPGCGKSTLALKFAWKAQAAFDAVVFQPCGQRTAEEIAVELAGRLKLEGIRSAPPEAQLEAAQTWLRDRLSLLVLDDAWNDDAQKLLPGPPVSVLVTSQRRNWSWVETSSRDLVESFSPQEAEMCFRTYLGTAVVAQHLGALLEFARRMDRLPLAVAVAAAMLRDSSDPVEEAALGLKLGDLRNVANVIEKAIQAQPKRELRLLQAMAVCAPEGFWKPLAARIAGLDDHEMSDASNRLFNSSLLQVLDRERGRFQLHALLREQVRRSAPLVELQESHAAALERLFEHWEKRWRNCRKYLQEVIPALEHIWKVGDKLRMERLCDWSSNLAWRIGQFDAGLRIEIRREQFWSGLDSAEAKHGLEKSFGNQALILRDWGRLDDAMAMHKREESLCVELGDDEGLQYSYGNQALVLKAQGRLAEAMALLKKQEALCLGLGDDDGLQLSYGNQALILKDWGRLDEAMALHKKEEALCKDLGNKDGLQRSYGNQAPILLAWGRLDEAMELHHREEMLCLELGAKSPLGYCYWNWGLVARAQGDRTVEREKLQSALDIFTELQMPIERDQVATELARSPSA
jgi:tetratricopeptide (TPR) repeat protein